MADPVDPAKYMQELAASQSDVQMRTLGISPKLIAPITTPFGAAVYTAITTGALDRPSLALVALGVISAIGAYLAGPGKVAPVVAEKK